MTGNSHASQLHPSIRRSPAEVMAGDFCHDTLTGRFSTANLPTTFTGGSPQPVATMINVRNIREAILIAAVLFLSINSIAARTNAFGMQPTEDLSQVVTRSRPGVVEILTERTDGSAVGSGVVIRAGKDGSADILTAAHIVARAENLLVRMFDEKWVEAVVIVEDHERDVALIRTCCVAGVTPVDVSSSEPPLPGSPVFAMGYPMNGAATVTRGVVSAVTENLENDRIEIQTDAAINPGNSGGPLFSADGKLIGINSYTMKGDDGEFIDGISFAIAMSTVQRVIGE